MTAIRRALFVSVVAHRAIPATPMFKKRFRDVDYPRITFHAPERMFDRLLKESSLSDLKETVRSKLNLPSGTLIRLARLRRGNVIDLEDEDDFDAFCAAACVELSVDVQVTLTERDSITGDRPKKKHKQETARDGTVQSKKRKVAFTEPSPEGAVPSASEEPRKKKRKNDGGSVAAVPAPEPGSPHDISEAQRKKKEDKPSHESPQTPGKRKDKSKTEGSSSKTTPGDSSMQNRETTSRDQNLPPSTPEGLPISTGGSHVPSGGPPQTEPEHPTSSISQNPVAKVSAKKPRSKKAATVRPPTPSNVSISTKGETSEGLSKQQRDGPRKEQTDFAQQLAGAIDDANASNSRGLESPRKDDDLTGKGEKNVETSSGAQGGLKGETKKRTTANKGSTNDASSLVEGTGDTSSALDKTSQKAPSATQLKDITAKLLAEKRKSIGSTPGKDQLGESTASKGFDSQKIATDNKAGSKARGGAKSSETDAGPGSICLVCSKAPRHDLIECPIVREGPASIQRRIKAVRASKKIPDDEKFPLITKLQKIKAEQRVSGKRKPPLTKTPNLVVQSPSPPEPSDLQAKETADHRADSSKESPSVDRAVSSSRESSPDAGNQREPNMEQVNGDSSLIPPGIGEVSGLAALLDALVKGPGSSLLTIDDLPSSDDDDEKRMSGELEEDEEEERHLPAKSDSDSDSDIQYDDEFSSNSGPESKNPDKVLSDIQLPAPDHSSGPQSAEMVCAGDGSVTLIAAGDASTGTINVTPDGHTPNDLPLETQVDNVQDDCERTENQVSFAEEGGADQQSTPNPVAESRKEVESPALHNKGKKRPATEDASNGRKRTKAATKTPKKVDGLSLTQVSETIQNSVARASKRTPSETFAGQGSRLSRIETKRSANANGLAAKKRNNTATTNELAAPAPTPISLGGWTTLKELSPSVRDDGGVMDDDELLSSSPRLTQLSKKRAKKKETPTSKGDPSSIPSKRQPPPPYSVLFSPPDNLPNVLESDSHEESEVVDSLKDTHVPRRRRLSEISGPFFVKPSRPTRSSTSAFREKAAELYGKKGKRGSDVDDESESSPGTDSEPEQVSHIPKQRRAGRI